MDRPVATGPSLIVPGTLPPLAAPDPTAAVVACRHRCRTRDFSIGTVAGTGGIHVVQCQLRVARRRVAEYRRTLAFKNGLNAGATQSRGRVAAHRMGGHADGHQYQYQNEASHELRYPCCPAVQMIGETRLTAMPRTDNTRNVERPVPAEHKTGKVDFLCEARYMERNPGRRDCRWITITIPMPTFRGF